MAVMKLINGLPTSVAPYDESIAYPAGLAASTPITLPASGSFTNASADDLLIIYNDLVMEVTRDFTVVGAGPVYTQIQFVFALPVDAIVKFKTNIG